MINSHTSWQPLEEVIVGAAYPPHLFDFIEDSTVRGQLQQILGETEEDLAYLQRTIQQYGAIVHRPYTAYGPVDCEWFRSVQLAGGAGIPGPPITPRDWQITLGNKLLRILPHRSLDQCLIPYADQVINPHAGVYDPACVLNGASASCIVRVGRDIFFDNSAYLRPEQTDWIVRHVLGPEYRVHEAVTDGHGDAVFAILKPGVILSSKHDENLHFDRDFPGWEVLRVQDTSIEAAMAMGKFRYENSPAAWYVQGAEPTDEFRQYVNTYLKEWTGFVAESVFDVNCLVLDEENVIFSAYNRSVFDFCKRHRINPIICELRHSYFWDGGVSCCTQDLRRRGGLETYL